MKEKIINPCYGAYVDTTFIRGFNISSCWFDYYNKTLLKMFSKNKGKGKQA